MNKPLDHKSYGSIPHLSKSRLGSGDHKAEKGLEERMTVKLKNWFELIIVTEKLDGSNVSVAKIDDQIIPLGRAGYRAETSQYEMHKLFAKWVFKNYDRFDKLLNNGERIVGEWLAQAHGTKYKLPHEPYVVFDIMYNKHERMRYLPFLKRVWKYDFVTPRLLHIGSSVSVEKITKMLDPSPHGALESVEGAVWRLENQRTDEFMSLAKYVEPSKEDGCYLPRLSGDKSVWNIDPRSI